MINLGILKGGKDANTFLIFWTALISFDTANKNNLNSIMHNKSNVKKSKLHQISWTNIFLQLVKILNTFLKIINYKI